MKNFQGKRKQTSIMQSKFVLILLGCLVIFFAISLIGFMSKLKETVKNKKIAEEKVVALQSQKAQLTSSVDKLNTEQGTEDVIREKFGLGKDGEGVIVVVDDKTSSPASIQKETGFWSFFTRLFK